MPPLNSRLRLSPRVAEADEPDDDDHSRQHEPAPPLADELIRRLAGVELVTDAAETAHVRPSWAASTRRDGRTDVVRSRSTPRWPGSSPENRCPSPKNFVRASNVISGLVNRKTTTRSTTVDKTEREREPAHVADGEQVQHDRRDQRHDVGGDDRASRAHPAAFDRAAQRVAVADLVANRSKNTTNESAVTPIATIRPAMPASVSV